MPDHSSYCEQDLLLQVSNGNEPAFAKLFNQYHHQLAVYIFQLTGSRELAEEVVQDVFLKIWNDRASLAEIRNFNTWIYVISRNQALNALRKLVNEKLKLEQWISAQPSLEEETSLYDDRNLHLAEQAINQLSPQQKKVFLLSRVRKMKYKEIAGELNLSRETVKSYLKNASNSIIRFVNTHSHLFELLFVLGILFRF